MRDTCIMLWIGFFLDLILGDPVYPFHPIRLIGRLIAVLETGLRRLFPKSHRGEVAAGICMAAIVIFISAGLPALILAAAMQIHHLLYLGIGSVFCYQLLAVKSLKTESMKVYDALQHKTLEEARYAVSMIVGRDTAQLSKSGVAKAAVETVAENASDGCLAPMFFMMLFGPVGGFVYKAINTMDSMVGYRNEKYQFFGKVAARLDDVVNFIPARLCALLMILMCFGKDYNRSEAFRIFRRDRYAHKSPNSAQTESVMAGALGIRLAGPAAYFGALADKPYIGDDGRAIEPQDIKKANTVLYRTAWAAMLIYGCILAAVLL